MENDFLNFLNHLMEANPELTKELMTPGIEKYIEVLNTKSEKPEVTEKGVEILTYLQAQIPEGPFKACDVGTGLGIPARSISGALRKLVLDGFCAKLGKEPVIYELTEKGRNYIIK